MEVKEVKTMLQEPFFRISDLLVQMKAKLAMNVLSDGDRSAIRSQLESLTAQVEGRSVKAWESIDNTLGLMRSRGTISWK